MAQAERSYPELDAAIETAVAEFRRGGKEPAVDRLAALYPDAEGQIRRLFPAILWLERCGREIERSNAVTGPVPSVLGDFHIIREIGRGGMGVVFEGLQISLQRRVALKILPAAARLRREQLDRFRHEARAVARLHHTNIVQVHGVGETAGYHYFIMQLIEGRSLSNVCASMWRTGRGGSDTRSDATTAPFDFTADSNSIHETKAPEVSVADPALCQFVARVGLQAGEALSYAHSRGVLHRDIKPSNLILDSDDRIWITDFGLAKVSGFDDLTSTGEVPGTLRYMAPERLRGHCDERSDVFSLGLVLYEILLGRPAFDAQDKAALLRQVADCAVRPPREIARKVPRDLETIVSKCLEHDPVARYANADAVAADCRRFLEHEPILARRTSPSERLVRWSRRNKVVASLLATAITLLIAITVGALLAASHFRHQELRQRELADRNRELADQNARQNEDLRKNLYVAEMNVAAQEASPEGGSSRLRRLIEPWKTSQPDLRGWEWYYLQSLCRRDQLTIEAHAGACAAVAYSPDGRRIASGGGDNMVRIWDSYKDHEVLALSGHEGEVSSVAWSPDGKRFASASRDAVGTIKIWDAATGKDLVMMRGHTNGVRALSWSPDGTRLASGSDDRSVKIWDPATGQELKSLTGHRQMVWSVAWNHSGTQIASPDFGGNIRIWNASDGESTLLPVSKNGRSADFAVVWSPDDKQIAVGGSGGTFILNAKDGHVNHDFGWQGSGAGCLAWNPAGNQLAIGGRLGWIVRVFDVRTGNLVTSFRGHSGAIRSIAWHPDGSHLVSAADDGAIKCWDLKQVRSSGMIGSHAANSSHVAWSPDSKKVASASGDGEIKIWNLERPDASWKLDEKHPDQWVWWRTAWSHDGTRLACVGGNLLQVWDAISGKKLVEHVADAECRSVAWPRDHRFFLTGNSAGLVQAWDEKTGDEVFKLVGFNVLIAGISASPNGKLVAASGANGQVWVWDLASRSCVRKLAGLKRFSRATAWRSDGEQLAAGDDGGEICIWNAETGQLQQSIHGHDGVIHALCWHPSAYRLASASDDSAIRFWDPATGKRLLSMDGWTSGQLAWSPDGMKLAFNGASSPTIYVGDATDGYRQER